MFLNEFLRSFVNLFSAGYRLLRDSSCYAADSLGHRLSALRHSRGGASYSLAAREGKLSSARFACRRGAFSLSSTRLASRALATAAFASGALTASALAGSRLASRALASGTFSPSRLARR